MQHLQHESKLRNQNAVTKEVDSPECQLWCHVVCFIFMGAMRHNTGVRALGEEGRSEKLKEWEAKSLATSLPLFRCLQLKFWGPLAQGGQGLPRYQQTVM